MLREWLKKADEALKHFGHTNSQKKANRIQHWDKCVAGIEGKGCNGNDMWLQPVSEQIFCLEAGVFILPANS